MRQRGLDITQATLSRLWFGIPAPPDDPGDPQTVGVGVMDYHGTNDDRGQADEIYASYVEKMKFFVRWLVDSGRKIRLFVGDTNGSDEAWCRRSWPTCGHTGPISTRRGSSPNPCLRLRT